jgi:hypothetical protein
MTALIGSPQHSVLGGPGTECPRGQRATSGLLDLAFKMDIAALE